MAGPDSVDGDLGDPDAAQHGLGHGHVGGQRLRRYQLPEQPSLLAAVSWDLERPPPDKIETACAAGYLGRRRTTSELAAVLGAVSLVPSLPRAAT